VSYVLTYVSERVIPSGLVAIAFTLMVFLTPLFAWLAYRHQVTRATWIGGSLGVLGVMLCFLPGALTEAGNTFEWWAVVAMLIAAIASSIAAVISLKLNERAVPVTTYTAWAMAYGGIASLIYAALFAPAFAFETRVSFWLSFVYLTVLGTVVTFLCYLELMRREGSARAMYIGVLSPIGALLVSIALEKLRLDLYAWLGIALALFGAWYTLRSKGRKPA
jgi:drug/metabolite transporter (DMT)-like permease